MLAAINAIPSDVVIITMRIPENASVNIHEYTSVGMIHSIILKNNVAATAIFKNNIVSCAAFFSSLRLLILEN